MRRSAGICTTFATAALLTLGPGSLTAQEPFTDRPATQEPVRAQTATGELLAIDPDTMTLTVKAADDTELSFAYTPETVIVGSQDGIAGLATRDGVLVTVHYEEEGGTRTATRIDVDERR